MLNTRHAHPFTIILGVKNQSEAMAASRYPFSGGHAGCKKLSWYMWCCFCFRAFVLVVGTSKYCFMAQQVSTCRFSLFIPLESVVVGYSSTVMDWQRETDERKVHVQSGMKSFEGWKVWSFDFSAGLFSLTVATLLLVLGIPGGIDGLTVPGWWLSGKQSQY